MLSVIFVFCLIPKFKFKKAIEDNIGIPCDGLSRRGFSKQHINIGVGFPGGAVVENLPANAGDTGSSPRLGRSHMLRSN